jgi:putative endonuclease
VPEYGKRWRSCRAESKHGAMGNLFVFILQLVKTYIVYILKCKDSSYYTGITNDIERRLEEHNKGVDVKAYTFNRRPVVLVFTATINIATAAINFEKQVKGWSRKKKDALINGDFELLKELAECKNITHYQNK